VWEGERGRKREGPGGGGAIVEIGRAIVESGSDGEGVKEEEGLQQVTMKVGKCNVLSGNTASGRSRPRHRYVNEHYNPTLRVVL
jgi:hypothetical protein